MSQIKMLRLNAFDPIAKGSDDVKFFFKVTTDEDGESKSKVLCNFCVTNKGIYYFKKKSWILSKGENPKTLKTNDGFISMESLQELFEGLIRTGLARQEDRERKRLSIKKRNKQVTIQIGTEQID